MSDITPLHCIDYGCFKCTLKVHVHFESTLPIVNHIDMTVFYYLLFVCSTTLRINVMNTSLRKGIWGNCILFRFRFGIIDDSDYICTSIKFRVYEDMEAARMVE